MAELAMPKDFLSCRPHGRLMAGPTGVTFLMDLAENTAITFDARFTVSSVVPHQKTKCCRKWTSTDERLAHASCWKVPVGEKVVAATGQVGPGRRGSPKARV